MLFDYNNVPKGAKDLKVRNYSDIAGMHCEEVDTSSKTLYKDMHKLGWDMVQTCIKNDGIGLAAPQIGVFKNVFIMIGFVKPDIWSFDGNFHMIINPTLKVEKSWGETPTLFSEGCLSVPGETYGIQRMYNCSAQYYYFDAKNTLKKSIDKLS